MRLHKLHDVFLVENEPEEDNASKNIDAFAQLIQCFDDRSLSLVLSDARQGRWQESFANTEESLHVRIRLDLVKHLMIKISKRSFTLRFDDSMSSFSSEKKIKI